MTQLRQVLDEQMKEVESKEKAQALQQAAAKRRGEILDRVGVSPEKFTELNKAVTQDPELKKRVAEALDEAAPKR